jgi:DNA helicase HerA-like ATPase
MSWPWRQSTSLADPLIRLAEAAKIEDRRYVQDAILAVVASDDGELATDLSEVLQIAAAQEILRGTPFRTPQPEDLLDGVEAERSLLLGKVAETTLPFLYPEDWLTQHAVVLGASGTGKTTLIILIALQLLERSVNVIITDRDKQDYRHLLRLARNLLVFDARESFAFNPLQVQPGIRPEHSLDLFVIAFSKSNNLLDGSENMLRKAVYSLFERRGILEGTESYPTLYDLLYKIRSFRFRGNSRQFGFQDSLINRLEAYLAEAPQMYAYSKGFSVADLAAMSFVLEVKGLGERHARFLSNHLLYQLFLHRIATGQRGNRLQNLVIFDEAMWLAPVLKSTEQLGFPPIAMLLSQAREVGLGILLASQTAAMDPSIFVNSRLKIAFRLGSGVDQEAMAKAMALTPEQRAHFPKLGVGEAIVRMPGLDPFLINTPRLPE